MSIEAIEKATRLEQAILAEGTPVEVPIAHWFSPGVYAREMRVPAGTVVVGKIHKYAQLNILSAGDVSIYQEDEVARVQAPFTMVAPPGAKRVFFAHTDFVWTVIHGTDEQDVDKIEEYFIAPDLQTYLTHAQNLQLEMQS
jgi:hypothetical protein